MLSRCLRPFFAMLVLVLLAAMAQAQTQPPPATAPTPGKPLAVGIFVDAPFVSRKGEGFSGIAVELWESIAGKQGLTYAYKEYPSLAGLLEATQAGSIDVAVAPLTITQNRLQRMDFTQPYFDSGLRIMIEQNRGQGFWDIVEGLRQSGHLAVYMWIIAIVAGATLLLTLVDRYMDEEFPDKWHEGLAESFYHVMSVATSGKAPHKLMFGVFGRVMAAVWMVCGVALVAYITSSITSVMTTTALNTQINSFADLPGKTVGVLKGSVGESYSLDTGIDVIAYDDLPGAVAGLLKRQTNAVVADGPVLEYYDRTHPDLPITEVGGLARPEKLGFALPQGSALTRPLSLGIVAAREDGLVDRLRMKYFGGN